MEVGPDEFGVFGLDVVFEPSTEFAFVSPLIVDDDAVRIRAQVVHEKPVGAAEVPMEKRHLRIDLPRIRGQQFHAVLVPLEADAELRLLIFNAGRTANTRGAARAGSHGIFVRQHQLIAIAVAIAAIRRRAQISNKVEAKAHAVRADEIITERTREAVTPVGIGRVPLGEAPIGLDIRRIAATCALLTAQLVEAPGGIEIGHKFDVRHGFPERVFPGVTFEHGQAEIVLQDLRRQLEHRVWIRIGVEENFVAVRIQIPLESEGRLIAVGDLLVFGPEQGAFTQEGTGNVRGRGTQDFVDDESQVFLRLRNVHELVVAEKRRLVGCFLCEIRETISAETDLMRGWVARIAGAGSRGHTPPRFRGIRPYRPQTVLSDFRRRAHWRRAGRDVTEPAIRDPDILHDFFVKDGGFIH